MARTKLRPVAQALAAAGWRMSAYDHRRTFVRQRTLVLYFASFGRAKWYAPCDLIEESTPCPN